MIFQKWFLCEWLLWECFMWMIFQKKCFSCYILLTDQISLSDCIYFLEILGNMSIAIICFPGCAVINFEINLIFLIKPFFCMTKKSKKSLNILIMKRAFKVNKNHTSSILKSCLTWDFVFKTLLWRHTSFDV